ncbi:MAG: hypothetical protein JWO80_3372 [Bryobacterales bacterium]|nr:hypothetical protein [Bryobacterales bacterium]
MFALGLGAGALAGHGQTTIDLRTQSKSVDFSAASATKPLKTGTVLPASCGTGELFFQLGAPAGKNTYGCIAPNTWTLQSGSTGLPDGTNHANQVLSTDGTNAGWQAFSGDVTGAPQSLRVSGLQGRQLAGTQPADGQVLRWNSSASDWEPGQVGTSPNFAKTFTNAQILVIAGTEHNMGTPNLIVNCYDTSSPAALLQPAGITVDVTTFNVTVTFAAARSGRCVVNGSGGSGLTPSAGGDVAGLLSAAKVQGLQNRPVSPNIPTDGQVLTWSQTAGQWQAQAPAAGSGGSGGGQFNALGVTYANSTTLNLGAGCSASSPCNARFGNIVYSVVSSSTAVVQPGIGRAYIYIASNGVLTVGSNLAVTCSPGCVAVGNITSFPPNVIPLYMWNALASGWDPAGATDLRSSLATKIVAAGLGLIAIDSGIQSTIAVDAAAVPGYLTGTASLSFATVAAASCTNELSIGVPGASPGDSVAPGWPSLPANLIGMMRVVSNDIVGVKLCNPAGAAAAVPLGIFRATIIRSL